MKTFLILAILAVVVIYFVFFRKKAKPRPTETLYLKSPLPRTPTATVRKPIKITPPPRHPIKAASGHTYVPNDDGTYRNTTDNSIVTWLMLYVLLSDADRNEYPAPYNYDEGMTFTEARRESAEELLAHGSDDPPASPTETAYTPDPSPSYTPDASSDHRSDPTPSYTPDPSPSYSSDPSPSYSPDF